MRRILPPVYFFAALAMIPLLHFFVPSPRLLPVPWNLIGLLLLPLGAFLTLFANGAFRRVGTTVKPFQESQVLVTEGVFRFTRNPMYLGLTLILAGEAILFGTAAPPLGALFFALVMDRHFIVAEERMLRETFGDEFREYCARVRRWL